MAVSGLLPKGIQDAVADLPVMEILDRLDAELASQKMALVQAPPGAGKTTVVPLALMDRHWLSGKKIVMLEPRRLAARACAARMAELLGERPGQTVGYQVRMDRCISPRTRIEIITEGILTRRIQSDPELADVGLLIFDEFHERHLHGDLGLALGLECAEVFNPELRILVMSATMDTAALSDLMGGAPVIESPGKIWPVQTRYLDPGSGPARPGDRAGRILPACFRAVTQALDREAGDILVFLPGAAQIRRLAAQLKERLEDRPDIGIYPLFGNLSPEEQAAAIAPSLPGRRKVVLATPIAETSLTIRGVRVVVDSGLAKAPRFDPGRGMTRLETLAVSRASADQRRGRAGRTGPGVCYRLWSEHAHQGLVPFNRPEILSTDLAPLALDLALWGVGDPGDLKWLDLPPKPAFDTAKALLRQLDALDDSDRITDHGRNLLRAGTHPRLAHMIIRAVDMGLGFTACCLAALTEERDILASEDPDIGLRLDILETMEGGLQPKAASLHRARARSVLKRARHLASAFKVKRRFVEAASAGRLLALAWPGRVAKKRHRDSLSYISVSGSGYFFRSINSISGSEYIVAVHVDGRPRNAAIFLAAAYSRADLERDFPSRIQVSDAVFWDRRTRSVRALSRTVCGGIVLDERPAGRPDAGAVLSALITGIRETGLHILPWHKKLSALRYRTIFLKTLADDVFKDLPDLGDKALEDNLATWLAPFLDGISSAAGLRGIDLESAVKSLFTWDQLKTVETHAPTHITVPSGSRIPVRYADENGPLSSPVLAVRLQEMFGLADTPAIARGRVPLTLHLLSPASRPVQITRDLASFWQHTYTAVKKDLMGRYPKHYWPDDPMTAVPTARAKPRAKPWKK